MPRTDRKAPSDQVMLDAFTEHPEWPARMFVEEYGWDVTPSRVTAYRHRLTGPRRAKPQPPPDPTHRPDFEGRGMVACGICTEPLVDHPVAARCPELPRSVTLRGPGPARRERKPR